MQVYVICAVLLCAPAVLGLFSARIVPELHKYRDDCIAKIGLTNTDVISKIKSGVVPGDGSADAFAACMLQTFKILKEDGAINPDVSSYYLLTDDRNPRDVAEKCVPKSGSVSGKKATTVFNCLRDDEIIVLIP